MYAQIYHSNHGCDDKTAEIAIVTNIEVKKTFILCLKKIHLLAVVAKAHISYKTHIGSLLP